MPGSRWLLAVEFSALFVALPLAALNGLLRLPLFVVLWGLAALCLTALLLAPDFDRSRLWNAAGLGRRMVYVVVPFVVLAPLPFLWLVVYEPERLFGFVRQRPLLWALVMLLYPALSVYPQGIVYRIFVFHRYRKLFPRAWMRVLASAVAFSLAHVVFENWIAPVATLFAGLLFAWTYERTRSALVAGLQHAAFGCYIFTIGLGWYFYYGAVR